MRLYCLDAASTAALPSPLLALLLLPLLPFLASGCGPEGEAAPDVSDIALELRVGHFERDLADAARAGTRGAVDSLRVAYPVFFDSVWMELMVPGRDVAVYDSAIVRSWATQRPLRMLLDTVLAEYPAGGAADWEADLREALRYARYYLPERPTPTVVSYVSEMALGAFTYGDRLLGVGLDFHLGAGFPGYDPGVFPRYIQRAMDRAHLVPQTMEAYVTNVVGEAPGERMLDQMVHNGKVMYVKRKLMPHLPDTAVLGFGAAALEWLRDNEVQLWTHYLDEGLLYETKPSRIGKLVGPSPNAPGMPPEAPGANANWVGMRIVEAYHRRHPDLSLGALVALDDAQALLTESRYKPGR